MQASVPRLLRPDSARLPPGVALAVILITLLAQVFLPLYFRTISTIDLLLLVLIYMALEQRNPVAGLFTGAAIGLAQDALTHGPVGVFGIIKTLIGYLAAQVSLVIEVGYPGARSVLAALFYLIHQLLFWTMQHVLLGNEPELALARSLMLAAAHAGVALLAYRALDGFKKVR